MSVRPSSASWTRTRTSGQRAALAATAALALGASLLLACDAPEDATAAATATTASTTATATATGEGTAATPDTGTGGEARTPTPPAATQAQQDTPTPGPRADIEGDDVPDAGRAMGYLRHLAEDIGVRAAGTEGEREAAEYVAGVLQDAGYTTSIEPFEFQARIEESSVALADGSLFTAYAMQGSPNVEAAGTAVFGGLGTAEDLAGADLRGKVVVFDRGTVTFGDKVSAAVAGGAAAVVIVNDEDGPFRGALGGVTPDLPVVAVAGNQRDDLQAAIGTQVTVTADFRLHRQTSRNVVASVGGAACEAYLGAHYDSVPQGPGANDNASGTAVVLEVARTNPRPGLCVIAFGAEEVGLFGSQHYVGEHLAGTARFMLNVDMAGRLDGPIVVGDAALTEAILDAVDTAGVQSSLRAGTFPPFSSSDHVSFSAVGVPAVTFNSGDDEAIHTAQDTVDRIDPAALSMFLDAVDASLDALLPVAAAR